MIEYLLRTFSYGVLARLYVWARIFTRVSAWMLGLLIVVMVLFTLGLGKFWEYSPTLIKPAVGYLILQGLDLFLVGAWRWLLAYEQRRASRAAARA